MLTSLEAFQVLFWKPMTSCSLSFSHFTRGFRILSHHISHPSAPFPLWGVLHLTVTPQTEASPISGHSLHLPATSHSTVLFTSMETTVTSISGWFFVVVFVLFCFLNKNFLRIFFPLTLREAKSFFHVWFQMKMLFFLFFFLSEELLEKLLSIIQKCSPPPRLWSLLWTDASFFSSRSELPKKASARQAMFGFRN